MGSSDINLGREFDEKLDGQRIRRQMDVIREYMLSAHLYLSLAEIERALRYPQASISAQLRHLKKEAYGSHIVTKRRRGESGTWEYMVKSSELVQAGLAFE